MPVKYSPGKKDLVRMSGREVCGVRYTKRMMPPPGENAKLDEPLL